MADLEAVRAYQQGWVDRDMAAIHASLTDDGTYEDPSTGGPIAGEALTGYVASGRRSPT
jgi:hypothetical protein